MGLPYFARLLFGVAGTIWLIILALIVVGVIARWIVFRKARQHGWAAIVPFYRDYIEYKIYWGNGWLFLIPCALTLLVPVPLFGIVFLLAKIGVTIVTQYKKATAFGCGVGFTIGLVLLNPIFNMILAFGDYQYRGIPQDGFSYEQIKEKLDKQKAKADSMAYTQPSADSDVPHMNYTDPDAPPKDSAGERDSDFRE